jgi:hypothetical protein
METKKCNKCNRELEVNDFHFRKDNNKYRNDCKECFNKSRKEYSKKYKENNKERIKESNKVYNNLEKTKQRQAKYRKENKEHLYEYQKGYRKENKEKMSEINNRYYIKNKDKILEYAKNYKRHKYHTDDLFKLTKVIRSSITHGIKNGGYIKSNKTEEILGCSFEEFKEYLESKFEDWMEWDNHGVYNGEINYGWDIDHIIPLSSANSECELIKLNHYTNLQPLDSHINRNIKRNNINEK